MSRIELRNVGVDIPIYGSASRSLKRNVLSAATGGSLGSRADGRTTVQAISDLTLTIEKGQRIGLIGHNGAGKSTLLRVIAGIYEPTNGSVEVEGEVASMFDLGFGMDPEATGWQNIVFRGMLLGLSKREIRARAEEIGEVSGLGEFLDMPLRTYSAGMTARLAFSISTAITPDILLVDEGIGAGDAAFIVQAQKRMKRLISDAGIFVLASHSVELLKQWCSLAAWMEHGKLMMVGEMGDVLAAYTEHLGRLMEQAQAAQA